jgi:hypothetical protein
MSIPLLVIVAIYIIYKINNIKNNSNNKNVKTYSVSNVVVSFDSETIVFKDIKKPGVSHRLFIIPMPEENYLLVNVNWNVVPNPVINIDPNIYWFANGKHNIVQADIKYNHMSNILEGSVPWYGESVNGKEPRKLIEFYIEHNEMTTVVNSSEFEKIKRLPGFENAVYVE